MKVPGVPYLADEWRRRYPGQEVPDGGVFTRSRPADPKDNRRTWRNRCG